METNNPFIPSPGEIDNYFAKYEESFASFMKIYRFERALLYSTVLTLMLDYGVEDIEVGDEKDIDSLKEFRIKFYSDQSNPNSMRVKISREDNG